MRTMSPDTIACGLSRAWPVEPVICAAAGAMLSASSRKERVGFMIFLAQRSICEVDCSIWSVAVMTLAFIS